GFSLYAAEPLWFDFLKTRLLSFTDIADANIAMHRLLENELELPLILEMLRFLATSGELELFSLGVKKALPLLTSQEELIEVLTFAADYYRRLDEEAMEQAINKIIDQRKEPQGPLKASDP